MGRRRAEPYQDDYAEQQVRDWSQREPETLAPRNYRVFPGPPSCRGHLLHHPHRGPRRVVAEALNAELRAGREVRDSLWPASDRRTRPLMLPRRGHLAILVAPGFLDYLEPEADGQQCWSRAAPPRNSSWWRRPRCTGNGSKPIAVSLDLDDGAITDIQA